MRSIRSRLLLWLIIPLSVVASLASVEAYFSVRRVSDELHDRTLQTVLLTLSEHMQGNENELVTENLLEVLTEFLGDQFFYHFVAPDNVWVIGYGGVPLRPSDVTLGNGELVFYDGQYQGAAVRAVTAKQFVSREGLQGWTTLTVWQRTRQRQVYALDLFTDTLIRLALLVAMAGLVAWWAVARGLRPLDDLRDAVAKRSPDDLSPIRRAVPTELRPVAQTMNALFQRVSAAGSARERLIGDAAHQLRNPVAALQTQSQNILTAHSLAEAQSRAEGLVESTTHLGRLVEQMLVSARSNAGAVSTDELIDLVALASQVSRAHGSRAIERHQELAFDSNVESIIVRGHEGLLREAIANLIDNAIRHNPEGIAIDVSVTSAEGNGSVMFSVSDTGPAISAEQFEGLTAAFSTGAGETAGSGLGLSIVADIVRLHGGSMDIEAASGADGKAVCLRLPLACSEPG